MAASESLKVRASSPKSEGISAAETMVNLEQPEEGYPTDPADPFAAAKPIDWSLHPVDSPLQGVPIPGSEQTPYPADLLAYRRTLEPDPAASFTGDFIPAKKTPTYDPIYGAPQEPRTEFGLPTVLGEVGRGFLDMFAGKTVDPLTVVPMLGAPQAIGVATKAIPEGSLGIFGGRYAENVTDKMHKEYDEARLMLDTGSSVEEVYNATRKVAMRREDIDPNSPEFYNQPRSEQYLISHHIPDNEMTVNKKGLNSLIENSKLSPGMPQKLENVMNHESLYEAYPWLRDVEIAVFPESKMGNSIATWLEGENLIKLNARFLKGDPEQVLSYILHEASHAIQGKESFVAGKRFMDNPQFAKGSNEDFEYSKIAASRPNKNLPSTLNDAMNKIAGLRSQIETDVDKLDFKIDEKILGEAEAFGNKSPSWVSHNLHRYQRHELARKLDKQGQEAFLNMYSGMHAPMNAAEAKLFESKMAEFRRLGDSEQVQDFMDLQSKVRENVELSEVVEKSTRNYLINAGELQARLTQAMRNVGADDPDNPQFRFNEALKEIKHEAEFLSTPSSLTQDYFKKAGSDDPTGGLFSAQHMDSMADAVSPKTASGHKINTSFGLGKMKTPKDMNKGGYVMTGAETMMGLD
jgi:hypothetical protein